MLFHTTVDAVDPLYFSERLWRKHLRIWEDVEVEAEQMEKNIFVK